MATDAPAQLGFDLAPASPFAVGDRVRVVRAIESALPWMAERQGRVGTVVVVRRIPGPNENANYKPIAVHLDDDWREYYYDVDDLEAVP